MENSTEMENRGGGREGGLVLKEKGEGRWNEGGVVRGKRKRRMKLVL